MKRQPTVEKKMADWITAFNSISDKQSQDAKILRDLTLGLKEKTERDGMIVIPGMA